MSTLASIVTTGEIFAIFVLCLTTSFGIAYLFLRTVLILTTHTNQKDGRSADLVSRRSLAALWLRSNHHAGR
jgi:hypothetical protein